jgi:hypothetical protein
MKDITIVRISDTRLVQLVESDPPQLVIIDDATGEEMTFSPKEVDRLATAINYFHPFMHEMFKKPNEDNKPKGGEKCPACGADYNSLDTKCFPPDPTQKSQGWADRHCAYLGCNVNNDGSIVDK